MKLTDISIEDNDPRRLFVSYSDEANRRLRRITQTDAMSKEENEDENHLRLKPEAAAGEW